MLFIGEFTICGIAGYIGESKHPDLSHLLVSNLFEKTESRGRDAAGVWGVSSDGRIIYHKEPVRSTVFLRKPFWKSVGQQKPVLLLTHCRAASDGDAAFNENNHPFVSTCKNIGLIHNGVVSKEYRCLKDKYEVISNCDSEILLRIFEAQDEPLQGIKDIWSFINQGSMAVAIGEKTPDSNYLWLFRNEQRSLWLTDLREELGQIFFFSTPDIWQQATDTYALKHKELIEIPPREIWSLETTKEEPIVPDDKFCRYEIKFGKKTEWKCDENRIPVKRGIPYEDDCENWDDDDSLFNQGVSRVSELCGSISDLASDVLIATENQTADYNANRRLDELCYQLEQIREDLRGTLRMIE